MFSKLEEDFGLSRHAMAVYERATKAVPKNERYEVCVVILDSPLSYRHLIFKEA